VIVDVMIVATGFVFRAWAGALAVDVAVSHWLVLCSFVVALFLGFVKRRQEIAGLDGDTRARPALESYSVEFLDQAIPVVTASTVLAYSLYALSPEVAAKLGTPYMGLTIPPVLFGIFRYLFLVHRRGEGDNPTEVVLGDRPLQATVAIWAALVLILLRTSS
jgi:4-hydroxybenzoate polyprenyltransferase